MKKNILLASLTAAGLATAIGLYCVFSQNVNANSELATSFISTIKLYQISGILGLFSISAFFVGLAYPSEVIYTSNNTVKEIKGA